MERRIEWQTRTGQQEAPRDVVAREEKVIARIGRHARREGGWPVYAAYAAPRNRVAKQRESRQEVCAQRAT